ncbi:hypothetical protein BTVI_88503 [Pitangus sulphuratus]|nr:hypothetical protein BTVI_88503 [Pitangus sulphuratus]
MGPAIHFSKKVSIFPLQDEQEKVTIEALFSLSSFLGLALLGKIQEHVVVTRRIKGPGQPKQLPRDRMPGRGHRSHCHVLGLAERGGHSRPPGPALITASLRLEKPSKIIKSNP